jgi:hypothetical protein
MRRVDDRRVVCCCGRELRRGWGAGVRDCRGSVRFSNGFGAELRTNEAWILEWDTLN